LHGGNYGEAYCHKFWNSEPVANGVKFTLFSPDGDCDYPGAIQVSATYKFSQPVGNQSHLQIIMEGVLEGDKSTPIALTNHSYFNLAGHNSNEMIHEQRILIDTPYYTAVDGDLIPTRQLQNVLEDGQEHMNLT
jgi:aldose 1-epimerase